MSGNIVNRPRPGKYIDIILDEIYNKSVPKPTNLRPGYDIEYIRNRYGFLYPGQFEKMVEVEKIFDNLSIISSYETLQQWAIRVKDTLQALITEGHKSYYHAFCLFGSSGQGVTKTYYDNYEGREVAIGYHRPNTHNCKMAICFDCWKLVEITDVKPKKTYFIIQRAYRNYKKRPESLAKQIWKAVRNDGTPDRWKYLGIIPRDVYYYYINGELIEFNWKVDHFNVLYNHTLYSARTWAEEKQEQLDH
ncbi:hypothetical protein C1646_822144 [Rhizophagus diaphanus]|nr:hypothetical protein C1646_822144 [Rhizophagus diaphanus] [Rhizophagus sp. MUCL 43196]